MKWTVTGQRPGATFDANGNAVQGMNVAVTLDNGHTLSVFVPDDAYTPDQARELIAARVKAVTDIGGLTGET